MGAGRREDCKERFTAEKYGDEYTIEIPKERKTMKKQPLAAVSLLLLLALLTGVFVAAQEQEKKPRHAPNALPGVEQRMLSADYWIGLHDDADEVIMTPAEIEDYNEMIRTMPGGGNSLEGPEWNPINVLSLPARADAAQVRRRLASNRDKLIDPDPLYGKSDFYDGRLATWSDDMKRTLEEKMNLDGLPPVIERQFGVTVRRTDVRLYPTHVPGYSDNSIMLDRFQTTDLCGCQPVAVLHRSKDGDFLFVESPWAFGWVDANDIALAGRGEVREIAGAGDFIMGAADRVPVYGDAGHENFARWLYFSGRMPLVSSGATGYTVRMPVRTPGGSLGVVNGYITSDADVHRGYFAYTKANVLRRFFKLLNTPYGWHGQDEKRDCVGTLRVLFQCFGIETGRSVRDASENIITVDKSLSREEKLAKAKQIEGIITVASNPGHATLFLGQAHNGMVYFMHQAGWGYKDEDGAHLYVNRVSLNPGDHRWFSIEAPTKYAVIRPKR